MTLKKKFHHFTLLVHTHLIIWYYHDIFIKPIAELGLCTHVHVQLFIYLFNKHSLSAGYVLGTVDEMVNETNTCSHGAYILMRQTTNK